MKLSEIIAIIEEEFTKRGEFVQLTDISDLILIRLMKETKGHYSPVKLRELIAETYWFWC